MDEATALLNLNSAKLEVLLVRLDTVARVVHQMSAEIDRLKSSVQKLTDVQQGAVSLLQQLAGEIRGRANDTEALKALADEVDQRAAELGKAVTENTPAAGGGGGGGGQPPPTEGPGTGNLNTLDDWDKSSGSE